MYLIIFVFQMTPQRSSRLIAHLIPHWFGEQIAMLTDWVLRGESPTVNTSPSPGKRDAQVDLETRILLPLPHTSRKKAKCLKLPGILMPSKTLSIGSDQ